MLCITYYMSDHVGHSITFAFATTYTRLYNVYMSESSTREKKITLHTCTGCVYRPASFLCLCVSVSRLFGLWLLCPTQCWATGSVACRLGRSGARRRLVSSVENARACGRRLPRRACIVCGIAIPFDATTQFADLIWCPVPRAEWLSTPCRRPASVCLRQCMRTQTVRTDVNWSGNNVIIERLAAAATNSIWLFMCVCWLCITECAAVWQMTCTLLNFRIILRSLWVHSIARLVFRYIIFGLDNSMWFFGYDWQANMNSWPVNHTNQNILNSRNKMKVRLNKHCCCFPASGSVSVKYNSNFTVGQLFCDIDGKGVVLVVNNAVVISLYAKALNYHAYIVCSLFGCNVIYLKTTCRHTQTHRNRHPNNQKLTHSTAYNIPNIHTYSLRILRMVYLCTCLI